jgi:hypothetical protein
MKSWVQEGVGLERSPTSSVASRLMETKCHEGMEGGKEGGETGWGDGGGFIGRGRGRRGSRGRRGGVGGGEIVEGVEMAKVVEP